MKKKITRDDEIKELTKKIEIQKYELQHECQWSAKEVADLKRRVLELEDVIGELKGLLNYSFRYAKGEWAPTIKLGWFRYKLQKIEKHVKRVRF